MHTALVHIHVPHSSEAIAEAALMGLVTGHVQASNHNAHGAQAKSPEIDPTLQLLI